MRTILAPAITYLTRPFWSWFVPDASNKSANGVTRIFGQDLSFLDEWVESLARTNHTSKYGADIIVNFWQHLEGGRASGLRRCRHLWKSRCAVALLMNIAVYIIDNLQVIEVTKMELKQILKDDHTSNWGKGRGISSVIPQTFGEKKLKGGYSQV